MVQTYLPEEVIVLFDSDDSETMNIISSIKKKKPLKIISLPLQKMERMSEILNYGIKTSVGDIIAFLDEDIIAKSEWLSRIIIQFEDKDVCACGGKDVIVFHGKKISFPETEEVGILKWKGYIVGNQHRGCKKREVMFLKGCNMAVRKRYLKPLDKHLVGFVRWEQDIFFNLVRNGLRIIYDPEIEVFHIKDNIEHSPSLWTYWYGHNTVYLFMKYLRGKDKVLAIIFFFLIGDGSSPGFIRFPFWVIKRNEGSLCTFSISQIGKIKGFFTYIKRGKRM